MNPPTTSVKRDRTEAAVLARLKTAISGTPSDHVLENVVKLLRANSDHYDWVGIYLTKGDSLILAAYAGVAETEHVMIPIGQGICGLAAKQPIKARNKVLGEIDIDSDRLSAFTTRDKEILEQAATLLASYLEKRGDRLEAYKVLQ